MAINIDELLAELEGTEKTAEESFVSKVTEDEKETEKVSSKTEVEETEEKETEKVSSKSEETEENETEKVSNKTEETEETAEKVANTAAGASKEELVKIATDMGKIAAHSFYSELVALGIMPPTNKDMAVPPISSVSLPSESPVTIKADADYQMAAGHDGYDARADQYGKEKKASVITPELLKSLHTKIYSEE